MDITTLAYVLSAYFIGSIPTGVILGRIYGQDPRQQGSGNIGASNVARLLGKRAGFITLFVDISKGAIATAIGLKFGGDLVYLMCGVAAVIGHCFPIWLGFRGGKGVATAFGTMFVVLPIVGIISTLAWVTTLYFTRTPAIGSLLSAGLFVGLPQLENTPFEVHCFTLTLALLIIIRHIGNIRTLRRRYAPNQKTSRRRRRK